MPITCVRSSRPLLALPTAALLLASPLAADEGMWMPQQVPELAAELRARGLELDPVALADLLAHPLGAVVSLGGCSASFVSPQGLIVTNHHCVTASLQHNATADRDLVRDGFLARTLADELPTAPGSYVYVTNAIRDVTDEVLAAAAQANDDAARARAVHRRRNELIDACERPGGVRCNVAKFFDGSLFLEIRQLEIQDVRLVYAPPEGIGNFGGEVDNWMWPRHTGDFAYLRAYVAADGTPAAHVPTNVPYRPHHWLRVASHGVDAGDLVWIAGYPGRTYRYTTEVEAEHAATYTMPTWTHHARAMIGLLEAENRRGRDVALRNYGRIRRYANTAKKYEGILLGMADGRARAQREEREATLAARAGVDRELQALIGDPLAELAALTASRWALQEQETALDWLASSSPLLDQALDLLRLASERTKPDVDRADGYRDRDTSRFLQKIARAQRSIEPASDRAGLRYAVTLTQQLPPGQRIAPLDDLLAATAKPTPSEQIEAILDLLYAGTGLDRLELRRKLATADLAVLERHPDSMLKLGRELAPLLAARRQREEAFDGAMLRIRPRYLEGLRAVASGRLYPDANSTLRLTFGTVEGYAPRDAVSYHPQTRLDGVLAKAGARPFNAPQTLIERAGGPIPPAYVDPELDTVPVAFLSTCDITGGNSGSPVLNRRGELVGLAFDGNWEGVLSDYTFAPEVVRTISVDALYMRWVMDAVDGAHHLLAEMSLPIYTESAP